MARRAVFSVRRAVLLARGALGGYTRVMSFTGTVENDTIKLPPGVHLPDGTRVTIEPREVSSDPIESESLSAFLERFAGCINTGRGVMAENHDHYAHGAPKGVDRL